MIKVLRRAVGLLEQLAAAPGPLGVRELALRTGLPPATCGRLLHDLTAVGWAERVGRLGFRPGPGLPALVAARPYAERLVATTREPLARLARRLHAGGAVAVLRGARRVRVVVCGPLGAAATIDARDDLYRTASGRVLLAAQPWGRRQRLIAELGFPAAGAWPGVATTRELHDELAAIRRAGWTDSRRVRGPRGYALAIPDGEGGVAALSLNRAGGGEELLAGLRRLAARVGPLLGG